LSYILTCHNPPTIRRLLIALAVFTLLGPVRAEPPNPVRAVAVPRPDLFPGATNPNITPENMDQNICKRGWSTKSIRPPSSYTTALKKTQLQSLGDTLPNELPRVTTKSGETTRPDLSKCIERSANPSCYEEDHLISLELGGDPRSPENLWPEPWFGSWNAHDKDKLENALHKMVCDRTMTLRDAQKAIANDWVGTYRKYFGEALQ
jgi:hypothetical protein